MPPPTTWCSTAARPTSMASPAMPGPITLDRKSTRLNSSHTEIYTLSLHDALPIWTGTNEVINATANNVVLNSGSSYIYGQPGNAGTNNIRSEEHTSELQSHRDLHSFPTRRSSDLDGHQ